MKKIVLAILVVGLAAGCSSVANIKTDDMPGVDSDAMVNSADVMVYSTDDIGANYDIIGQVVADADAGSNALTSVDYLKKEAAKLGADAIINLRLEVDYGYWQNAIKSTGTAVKIKQ